MTTDTDPGIGERQDRFIRLLEPIHSRLLQFCRALARDKDSARDLASEAILIAYRNFETMRDVEKLKSYLFSTASGLARRERTRLKRMVGEQILAERQDPVPSPEIAAEIALLQDALWQLPDDVREAIVLFEVSGFSIAEIASMQSAGISAVKMKLSRGRKQLRQALGIHQSRTFELV
jgi:RNA polymerase sigma-70 factor (ECF subfamily)